MKQQLYIFSDTLIKRKDSSLLCEKIVREADEQEEQEEKDLQQEEFYLDPDCIIPSGDKKYIPVESIDSIFTFGSVRFNSRFLYFLSQNKIPLHAFNFNGSFAGSFLPAERNISGTTLLMQAAHYSKNVNRMFIAKAFTTASARNCLSNLKYHKSRGANLSEQISYIEGELTKAQFDLFHERIKSIIDKKNDSVLFYELRNREVFDRSVLGIEKNEITYMI